jgi:hypothetical protein
VKNIQAILQLSDLDRGLLDVAIKSIEEGDKRLFRGGPAQPTPRFARRVSRK